MAVADPAMPSAGTGPQPKMNNGLSTMSSTVETSRKRNGVRESPEPRNAALTKKKALEAGSAMNSTRR